MAEKAGARISAHSASTARLEPHRVRVQAASPASGRGGMALGAIPFGVAADASHHVSLRFPGVVSGAPRGVRPYGSRRMKAALALRIAEGAGSRDASALVTRDAKRLGSVTARTIRVALPGGHGVHRNPVVRVDAPRAD